MKTIKIFTAVLMMLMLFAFAKDSIGQWQPTPYTKAGVYNFESGPVVKVAFWNMDSLSYPFTSPTVNIGKVLQDTTWLTYFTNIIAGDTIHFTLFGRFEYDSANAVRSKWDSCAYQKIVGNSDSSQVKQVKLYLYKNYNEVRVVVRRPSGGLPPILSSLSDRVLYITLTSKRNAYIPEKIDYTSPYK